MTPTSTTPSTPEAAQHTPRHTPQYAAPTPLLEASGIDVTLGGVRVLHDAAVTVAAGEIVGVIGPNGAGKSTLLHAITRRVEPDCGTITIEGRANVAIGARDFARRVAVVQQLPDAPGDLTVADLVLLGRHPHLGLLSRESAHDHAVAAAAMAEAGCLALAQRTLETLSGGQRRRVFIARALAQEPALLLLDEPTANLDVQAQSELGALLRRLATRGVGVLTVLHDLSFAASLCDRVVLLAAGEVLGTGDATAVLTTEAVRTAYGPDVEVIRHPLTGAPVVLPRTGAQPDIDTQHQTEMNQTEMSHTEMHQITGSR